MPSECEDCIELKKFGFQIDSLELVLQKERLRTDFLDKRIESKEEEYEQVIHNITARLDTMFMDFNSFKKDVKQDIAEVKQDICAIKTEIPTMFENAINRLLAKLFKAIALGVLVAVCIIILAFSRPVILKGLQELIQIVETVEVEAIQ